MSWFSIPLPNPFKSQEREEEEEVEEFSGDESSGHFGTERGVKEDLSELSKTIGRQLLGVASFLAPPPGTTDSTDSSASYSDALVGIRKDFAEIGGSLRLGISKLSTNKAVDDISKLASTVLQFQEDDNDGDGDAVKKESRDPGGAVESARVTDVVVVTEEVLEFARDLSTKPKCWIEFPLPLDQDFDMSEAQREHASTVERLAPSLAGLKFRLCPSHMSEGCFWKIYFVLLHPMLNEHDSEILVTPQIVEAWGQLQDIQLQSSEADYLSMKVSRQGSNTQEENIKIQGKISVPEPVTVAGQVTAAAQENTDQWLEEDDGTGTSNDTRKQLANEEDISFSDLEDVDDEEGLSKDTRSRSRQDGQDSSPNGSNEWVQLRNNSDINGSRNKGIQPTSQEKNSEADESSDWLNIDDFD